MSDPESAAEQFEAGLTTDPDSVDLRLELVRARLYVHDFERARTLMDEALARSAGVTPHRLRKLHDLNLQCYSRRADAISQSGDPAGALRLLVAMKRAYEDCPNTIIDDRITNRLGKAVLTARRIRKYAPDSRMADQAARLGTWLENESRSGPEAVPPPAADGSRREGVVTSVVADRGFGFVRSDEGHEIFFHVSDVEGISDLSDLSIGTRLSFAVRKRQKGFGAVDVTALGSAAR